jgi:hypothetical protein
MKHVLEYNQWVEEKMPEIDQKFHDAARWGKTEEVKQMFADGYDGTKYSFRHFTAVIWNQQFDVFKLLIENGLMPTSKHFVVAAKAGKDIFNYMLGLGLKPEKDQIKNIIYESCRSRHAEPIIALFEKCEDLLDQTDKDYALMIATSYYITDAAIYLVGREDVSPEYEDHNAIQNLMYGIKNEDNPKFKEMLVKLIKDGKVTDYRKLVDDLINNDTDEKYDLEILKGLDPKLDKLLDLQQNHGIF